MVPGNEQLAAMLADPGLREVVIGKHRDRGRALANEIWRVWRLNMRDPYELESTRWSQLVLESAEAGERRRG